MYVLFVSGTKNSRNSSNSKDLYLNNPKSRHSSSNSNSKNSKIVQRSRVALFSPNSSLKSPIPSYKNSPTPSSTASGGGMSKTGTPKATISKSRTSVITSKPLHFSSSNHNTPNNRDKNRDRVERGSSATPKGIITLMPFTTYLYDPTEPYSLFPFKH